MRSGRPAEPEAVDADHRWMRRALLLARRGDGLVSPNPLVGALVVRGGRVVGEGWHHRVGAPHAEVEALDAAGRAARGATLYVTLEPCNHHGRTPPCAPAVIRAGVARVVAAMPDPNPDVAGGGLRLLRRSGVEVRTGVLDAEAMRLNESYVRHVTTGLPLVLLKSAMSLDGRIAAAGGEARWISGRAARQWAHRVRRWADAVLVGIATVLADDPRLTIRDARGPRKRLLRAVLDTRLRMPVDAGLAARGDEPPTIVYTVKEASPARGRALAGRGVEVVRVRSGRDGRPSPRAVLRDLGRRGVGRLLVEGGGVVAAAFLRERLVDRVALVVAPVLLGSDGVPVVGELGVKRLDRAPRLVIERTTRLGADVLVEARPVRVVA